MDCFIPYLGSVKAVDGTQFPVLFTQQTPLPPNGKYKLLLLLLVAVVTVDRQESLLLSWVDFCLISITDSVPCYGLIS